MAPGKKGYVLAKPFRQTVFGEFKLTSNIVIGTSEWKKLNIVEKEAILLILVADIDGRQRKKEVKIP